MAARVRLIGTAIGVLALAASVSAQENRARRAADSAYDWAVAVGAGIVQPDDPSETYLTASIRRRIDAEGKGRSGRGGAEVSSRIRGYLEAEVGHWKRADPSDDKDTLVGLNLIGVMPTRGADLFVGVGFGLHFSDSTPLSTGVTESDTRLGGNLQFGVDVRVAGNLAIFGVGRFDLLKGDLDNQQTKIFGGLRLRL